MLATTRIGLNGLADGQRRRRNPACPCPGRDSLPAFGRRVENQLPIAGRRAVSLRSLTLAPMWMSPKSSVVSPSSEQQLRQRRSGHSLRDATASDTGRQSIWISAIELTPRLTPERRHRDEVAAQSRHREVDVAVVVNAGFDQHAAGANRFGIFGLQRTLLREAPAAVAAHSSGQHKNDIDRIID